MKSYPYQRAFMSAIEGRKNTKDHFFLAANYYLGDWLPRTKTSLMSAGFYAVKCGEFIRIKNMSAHTTLPYVADGFEIQRWEEDEHGYIRTA